ncbi:MAG: hypothetical protein ACLFM6_00645 [Spirochaetaceae bacterium]
MRMLSRAGLLAVLILPVSVQVPGLELTEGRIKTVLDEHSGRFTVAYRPDLSTERYVPLLDDGDPSTSALWIRDGNDVHRLGRSSRFDQSMERRSGGSASFHWSSARLEITERLTLVTTGGARLANAVLVELDIENVSETDREVEVRYLFDTLLAESRSAHFLADGVGRLRSETQVEPGPNDAWWESPDPDREAVAFRQVADGEDVTTPARIVFANWKRLAEGAFDYTVDETRTFSLLPYSINDSAVAVYYPVRTLAPGESRRITALVGAVDVEGYDGFTAEPTGSAQLLDEAAREVERALDRDTAEEELTAVDDILEEIDTLLAADDTTAEDVEVVLEILRRLEERRETYGAR